MSQRVRIDHVVVLLQTYKEVKSPQLKQAHLMISNGNYDTVSQSDKGSPTMSQTNTNCETYTYL